MDAKGRRTTPTGVVAGWSLAGAALAFSAVALEIAGSVWGDSPNTPYPGWLVPITWPTALRVVWWLAAAAGVVALQTGIARATGRRRRLTTAVAAAPFVVFAAGIATGAQWATFH